jgi:hypothetical protein
MRKPSDEDFRLSEQKFPHVTGYVISRVELWIFSGANGVNKEYIIGSKERILDGTYKLTVFKY